MSLKTFKLCFSITHTTTTQPTTKTTTTSKIYFLIINDDLEKRRTIYTHITITTVYRIFTLYPMINYVGGLVE